MLYVGQGLIYYYRLFIYQRVFNEVIPQYTPHVPPKVLVTILEHNTGLTSKTGRIANTTSYTFLAVSLLCSYSGYLRDDGGFLRALPQILQS